MRTIICLTVLSTVVGLSGCVLSEQPPFTSKDLVFEPVILGDWRQARLQDPPEIPDLTAPEDMPVDRIERTPTPGHYYFVSQDEGKKPERTLCQLFKLGDHYFACTGARHLLDNRDCHQTYKVTVCGNRLLIWWMTISRVDPTSNPFKIRDGTLTGSTAEVRQFFISHADDPGVWSVTGALLRESGLPVGPSGMTSQKQRTLDYWFAMRVGLHAERIILGTSGVEMDGNWSSKANLIRYFTDPTGVDPEAIACGREAIEFCRSVAEATKNRPSPKDPLAVMVRGTFGDPIRDPASITHGREEIEKRYRDLSAKFESTRKKLSTRYGCQFPMVTDPRSVERSTEAVQRDWTNWFIGIAVLLGLLVVIAGVVGWYLFYQRELSPYARGFKAGVSQVRQLCLVALLQKRDAAEVLAEHAARQANPKESSDWNAGYRAGWEQESSQVVPRS